MYQSLVTIPASNIRAVFEASIVPTKTSGGDLYPRSFRGLSRAQPNLIQRDASPRSDGRCGKDFSGAKCDSKGEFGGCCSSNGWCGKTDDHCQKSKGCQNGCDATAPSSPGLPPPKPPKASQTTEPKLEIPSTGGEKPTGDVTKDGSCGASNKNTVCGNWPLGSCCSMYGFCGNTAAHCGDGCQSGPCKGSAQVPAPGPSPAPKNGNPGSFKVVGNSGTAAMHAGLLPNGRVVFLDKVENYAPLKLANGRYAFSSEYDPKTNEATNAFCAGGTFLADGRFTSLGGNAPLTFLDPTVGDGFTAIRYLDRRGGANNGQDWSEPGNKLSTARWYASAQTLADGTIFVASGSLNGLDPAKKENNNPTYEILDRNGITSGNSIEMEILVKNQPYYMYPFMHLLKDGSMFVFVSKSSQRFDVKGNKIIKSFADLPGDYRTYPNTGTSVMTPLTSANGWTGDIIICGGGAYQDKTSPTDPSCGRIKPLADDAKWELESMPEGRGMVEGTLLADGTIIFVNGANKGAQGFELASDPTYEALLYDPTKPQGQRFTTGASSTIARLYHSVALLLLDGTLLITGSNPVEQPILQPTDEDAYVTEYRVEIYTPPYLSGDKANKRPTDVDLSSKSLEANGSKFDISFTVPQGTKAVKVALYHGGFVTHSLHMGHRMLFLDNSGFKASAQKQKISVAMPPNGNVAPPGPYVVYVLADGVPAMGQFVQVT
ncbi:MAG: hypothetical protein M1825_003752 [Sarcosagium campestre]|nr:MAG: hypothetical protein M1825_003752 [Sarcosagium campestre]